MAIRIVTALNQKGGVGKSTLMTTLAVLAHLDGWKVALLDTDPQGSLERWAKDRKEATGKDWPRVLIANDKQDPDRLRKAVAAAKRSGIDWLFIDTVGALEGLPVLAAELADIVLIPCSPSKRDMNGTVETVTLARRKKKQAFFVVNKGSSSKAMNDSMAVALSSSMGLPCVGVHIQSRRPTTDAELTGETLPEVESGASSIVNGQAEFKALWDWLQQQFEEGGEELAVANG